MRCWASSLCHGYGVLLRQSKRANIVKAPSVGLEPAKRCEGVILI